ncbi:M12 family metallopeptidase [Flavobacterium sp. J27]|uniref:M12 family metallopeptidase n=1 Tax=Flavobacterium sp. J27 TaxID=2060419 RepID=UPI001031AFD3|nr:M12 family metallopeptidase [Flavobacterium sp. J27]
MKKINLKKITWMTILIIGYSSCDKNDVPEPDYATEVNSITDEIYNTKTTGTTIEAIYLGRYVTLLEIDNDKYLYDGDVVLDRNDFSLPSEDSNRGVYGGGNWPNRNVRWKYASGVSQDLKNKWTSAMSTWSSQLNFTFTQISSSSGDYILVEQNSSGSAYSTSIGRRGGQQIISVDPRYYGSGNVVHEIGHAVGLIHEQKRPDRDNYIIVNYFNIKPNWTSQYDKCSNCTSNGSFDYNSIMLYGSRASSSVVYDTSIPAMTKKDGSIWNSQRSYLSTGDKAAINAKY